MTDPPRFLWTSDRTLRVELADAISDDATTSVRAVLYRVRSLGITGLQDVTPAYTTLMLTFDPLLVDESSAERMVSEALAGFAADPPRPDRTIEIPVCYGGEFGPDLADVAAIHGLTPERVIELHTGTSYTVAFLGFAPGFAYLAGLPAELHTPRLSAPRARLPAGSVGIGGGQTGVYPRPSSGGWRIIGRTPLVLFDPIRAEASLLRIGDAVRFKPMSASEFAAHGGEV